MKFIDSFIPPTDRLTKWRLCIAVAVALLIVNALFARGVIGGMLQYAYASEVAEINEKIDMTLTLQIAETLRGLRQDECNGNGDADVIARVIEKYQQEYFKLTGARYPLLHCQP